MARRQAQTLSTRTLGDIKSILRRALTCAHARDKVERNVVLLCETPTGQVGRPSKALTFDQAQALVERATGRLRPALTAHRCANRGAAGVDLEPRRPRRDPAAKPPVLPHMMVGQSVRAGGDTKTKRSRRTLALPERCVDALREQRDRQRGARELAGERWVANDLVFASEVGTELDSANVRRGFRRVAAAAGLNAAEWTPREMRHSFVSLLSDEGVPIEQIARLVVYPGLVDRTAGSRNDRTTPTVGQLPSPAKGSSRYCWSGARSRAAMWRSPTC